MKICIDAGHNYSGADTGVVGVNGLREQDITFDIANRLKNILEKSGHQVVMTRNSATDNLGRDVASSLRERVRISDEMGCEFFISIHCNSGVTAAMGTEVLISGRGGLAENYAAAVLESVTEKLGTIDRGVRVDTEYLGKRLYVLHNTDCPAILIEAGFLTNREDAQKLSSRSADFASAIAAPFGEKNESPAYPDIEGHWAQSHIEKLNDYGIVNGYPDGNFHPDDTVTRAQAAAMISNALSVLGK